MDNPNPQTNGKALTAQQIIAKVGKDITPAELSKAASRVSDELRPFLSAEVMASGATDGE